MTPCDACPRKFAPVPADGPQPCPVLAIGERPGPEEQKHRRPFVGKTGKETDNTYLPLGGLDRSRVRFTNTVLCFALANRTPTAAEIAACAAHHLPDELRRTQPEVVLLLGSTPCSLVPGIRLDMHHGRPRRAELFGWSGWVVPMFHPAIGLHDSRWMTTLLEDWEDLRYWLELPGASDPLPFTADYRLARDTDDIRHYFEPRSGDYPAAAVDTERHGTSPFSVQVSLRPQSAIMVLAEDNRGLRALAECLGRNGNGQYDLCLHNAPGDLDTLERLGIPCGRFQDTMQQAYHQGNLPQALKVLVYRLFNFTMTSWEDVVRPASVAALRTWLAEALAVAQADLQYVEVRHLKTKSKEIVRNGPATQLLTRLLRHTGTGEYDPWVRLSEFYAADGNEWMTAHLDARCGPYPMLGIGNCRIEDAVEYGCGDADWTGQVAVELERRRSNGRFQIVQDDQDA